MDEDAPPSTPTEVAPALLEDGSLALDDAPPPALDDDGSAEVGGADDDAMERGSDDPLSALLDGPDADTLPDDESPLPESAVHTPSVQSWVRRQSSSLLQALRH
jgi:hypothetical protein